MTLFLISLLLSCNAAASDRSKKGAEVAQAEDAYKNLRSALSKEFPEEDKEMIQSLDFSKDFTKLFDLFNKKRSVEGEEDSLKALKKVLMETLSKSEDEINKVDLNKEQDIRGILNEFRAHILLGSNEEVKIFIGEFKETISTNFPSRATEINALNCDIQGFERLMAIIIEENINVSRNNYKQQLEDLTQQISYRNEMIISALVKNQNLLNAISQLSLDGVDDSNIDDKIAEVKNTLRNLEIDYTELDSADTVEKKRKQLESLIYKVKYECNMVVDLLNHIKGEFNL